MKKIKIDGKLNLNKETVSKLDGHQMKEIHGGAATGLKCKTDNTLSWGQDCTVDRIYCGIDIRTRGIFCSDY